MVAQVAAYYRRPEIANSRSNMAFPFNIQLKLFSTVFALVQLSTTALAAETRTPYSRFRSFYAHLQKEIKERPDHLSAVGTKRKLRLLMLYHAPRVFIYTRDGLTIFAGYDGCSTNVRRTKENDWEIVNTEHVSLAVVHPGETKLLIVKKDELVPELPDVIDDFVAVVVALKDKIMVIVPKDHSYVLFPWTADFEHPYGPSPSTKHDLPSANSELMNVN
jgi:hypothetical protein